MAEICREAGLSQATYFNWRKKYIGLIPSEMKRVRDLDQENTRLKKIAADLSLDKEMLQEIIKRNVSSALPLHGSLMTAVGFAQMYPADRERASFPDRP